MKVFNHFFLFFIWLYQKTLSSHTWILKDFLYNQPVCTHKPHCSEYGKQCFQRYDFFNAFKYTMERIDKCTPDNKINYDPSFYKVVYFSSSPIWVPFLNQLMEDDRFEVVWLVSMKDAPSGRWQKLKENIVVQKFKEKIKDFEKEQINDEIIDLKYENKTTRVFKPWKIKNNKDFEEKLRELEADFFVVLSYWKILPKNILDIPKLWPINIHGSILPKYRGASPIQSVFLNQEKETWITIMYMDEWMDTGDIIKIIKFPLTKNDNSKTVIDKFIEIGPKFFVDTLWDFGKWKLTRQKQDDDKATYCGKFEKEDGYIDFEKEGVETIYSKFQAFYLWPWIYAFWNNKQIKFTDIDFEKCDQNKKLWLVFKEGNDIKMSCKDGNIILKKLKIEWKKEIDIKDFINGHKDFLNSSIVKWKKS